VIIYLIHTDKSPDVSSYVRLKGCDTKLHAKYENYIDIRSVSQVYCEIALRLRIHLIRDANMIRRRKQYFGNSCN